jgi:hypothetical protein
MLEWDTGLESHCCEYRNETLGWNLVIVSVEMCPLLAQNVITVSGRKN